MRGGWWPLGNVEVGGHHIHHFVPGILLAFGSGAAALLSANEKLDETLAIPFGVGMGLTLDEAALLLDLRDVYWTREGVLSVQVSLGATAIMGGTILALRMLRRGERKDRGRRRDPRARLGPVADPVAREELAGLRLAQERDDLEWPHLGVEAVGQPRAAPAGDLRGVGDEDLVDEVALQELGVKDRAALAEKRLHVMLAP